MKRLISLSFILLPAVAEQLLAAKEQKKLTG
jgi:hypothetical protein